MEAAEEHLHSPFHVDRSKVKITVHDTWHVVLQGVKSEMHSGTAQSISVREAEAVSVTHLV